MKKRNRKMISTYIIVNSVWVLGILIFGLVTGKIINVYALAVWIFTNFCIYIGLHDKSGQDHEQENGEQMR